MTAKTENLPLLQWIQDHGSNGTDQYFEYIFYVGEKSEFEIRVKGGEFGTSEPDKMLSSLAEYEKLNVQIFEWNKVKLMSSNISYTADPVFTDIDDRFSSQPWAQDCGITKSPRDKYRLVSFLEVSPDTICDIVHYCQKLIEIKAFW